MSRCKYCENTWHTSSQCFFKPNKAAKPCKWCTSTDHLSWQCFKNPNRKSEMSKKIRKGLKKGRVTLKWLEVRREWFKQNKADHYECYICGKWMTKAETTLDHIKSRTRHPELRFELSNLAPCCLSDNVAKGSLSLEEFLDKRS